MRNGWVKKKHLRNYCLIIELFLQKMARDFLERSILSLKDKKKANVQLIGGVMSCFGHNQGANDCLTELFGVKNIFSNPKPIELMKGLLQIGNVKNKDIVLDFFSGSASLAHAVIKMNSDDQVDIKYVMVQLAENLDESLKTADAKTKKKIEQAINFLDSINKPHTIPEIAKERIRRASKKIKEESPLPLPTSTLVSVFSVSTKAITRT